MLNPEYPVFANTRPWNELILRGVRSFKTISFPWKYRGVIYLYDTKGKADYDFAPEWAEGQGVVISPEFGFPGCIVGSVEVYGFRPADDEESETGNPEILLRNPQRMEAVPFTWISRGRIAKVGGPIKSNRQE
jgi:hypothetical protein